MRSVEIKTSDKWREKKIRVIREIRGEYNTRDSSDTWRKKIRVIRAIRGEKISEIRVIRGDNKLCDPWRKKSV